MSLEEEITVMVNPCQVNDYTLTSAVDSIEYEIGSARLTDGFYIFDENPYCNYQETVTVTNMPEFMTHDEINSEFTISIVTDLSKIGSYVITIKSEIQIPDDAVLSSYTTMSASYDLTVYLKPCEVDSYFDSITVGIIDYFIGTPT